MAVYLVHQPPQRSGETAPDPERFLLVRDGFHVWAFLFGPLWMIANRLWLVLVLYLALTIGLNAGLYIADAPTLLRSAIFFALALLLGLEASTLRSWTLSRRGWKNIGLVGGENIEAAERRFFAGWVNNAARATILTKPAPAQIAPQSSNGNSGIIGLFPEAGSSR